MACPAIFDHKRGEVLGCPLKEGHKRPHLMQWRRATKEELERIRSSKPSRRRYG